MDGLACMCRHAATCTRHRSFRYSSWQLQQRPASPCQPASQPARRMHACIRLPTAPPHLCLLGSGARRRRLPRLKSFEHKGDVAARPLPPLGRRRHAVILDLEHHVGPAAGEMDKNSGMRRQGRCGRQAGGWRDPPAAVAHSRAAHCPCPAATPSCTTQVPYQPGSSPAAHLPGISNMWSTGRPPSGLRASRSTRRRASRSSRSFCRSEVCHSDACSVGWGPRSGGIAAGSIFTWCWPHWGASPGPADAMAPCIHALLAAAPPRALVSWNGAERTQRITIAAWRR
jgi:hypothetical protein